MSRTEASSGDRVRRRTTPVQDASPASRSRRQGRASSTRRAGSQNPNGPRLYPDDSGNSISGPGLFNWNAALAKTVPFGRDGLRRLDFRVDTTNLLNHVNYSAISTVVNSATFGSVTGAGAMRVIYFTTRVNF